jgi:hypothetical protein
MQTRVDVIVMLEKNADSIMEWVIKTDDSGNLCDTVEHGIGSPPEKKWRELALEINRRARSGNHERVVIFLYLRNGLLDSISHVGILKRIAATAQHHVWAGNVYIAWDKTRHTTTLDKFNDLDNANLLVDFCCALLEEGVTDLIELPRNDGLRDIPSEKLRTVLHGRASTSRDRRAELKTLVDEEGWSHVLRNEARELEWLLNRFIKRHCLPSSSPNDMIIFEASAGQSAKGTIEKSTGIRRVVAATVESCTDDLKKACDDEKPPLNILQFRNLFEVLYALLQLNDAGKAKKTQKTFYTSTPMDQETLNANLPVEIEPVEVSKGARFLSSMATSPLNLLITSAFDEEAEPDHSKAAAEEIGAIRRDVTSLQDVEVYPYMTRQAFPKLLESKQYTAWIHLSHGAEGELYNPQKKSYVSPESWLDCFIAYRGSMSLVIFSSCNSARAARLFAAAGVGVAIGFKNKVLPVATKILAQKIVPTAMHSGGSQEAILIAFRDACRSLAARITDDGEKYGDAQPVAFRSLWK